MGTRISQLMLHSRPRRHQQRRAFGSVDRQQSRLPNGRESLLPESALHAAARCAGLRNRSQASILNQREEILRPKHHTLQHGACHGGAMGAESG